MRTTQRDQGLPATLSATVNDAASGSGVFQPGSVPFVFTRTAAGLYTLNFDTRIRAVAASVNPTVGLGYMGIAWPQGNGSVQVNTFQVTTPSTNFSGTFNIIASVLDKRF